MKEQLSGRVSKKYFNNIFKTIPTMQKCQIQKYMLLEEFPMEGCCKRVDGVNACRVMQR